MQIIAFSGFVALVLVFVFVSFYFRKKLDVGLVPATCAIFVTVFHSRSSSIG